MKSKQVLSVKQMKHLQELGLDTSDGSMCWCYALSYKNAKWELEIYEDVINQKRDSAFWEIIPTYTLQDILDKLPCFIGTHVLTLQKLANSGTCLYMEPYSRSILNLTESKELINSAYEMLCWCIKNGYVEKEGK
ncbi:hypothetical protein [Bacteroides sp. 2201st1_D9_2201SCRN_220225]|uniref:hypothetical protein n=1 Tax=Bacteroides sp. 2201st1_D9_2201SCRN_220225 TaxID=3143218 RepID=UPI0034A33DA8